MRMRHFNMHVARLHVEVLYCIHACAARAIPSIHPACSFSLPYRVRGGPEVFVSRVSTTMTYSSTGKPSHHQSDLGERDNDHCDVRADL
jgi:hypothetical protein